MYVLCAINFYLRMYFEFTLLINVALFIAYNSNSYYIIYYVYINELVGNVSDVLRLMFKWNICFISLRKKVFMIKIEFEFINT